MNNEWFTLLSPLIWRIAINELLDVMLKYIASAYSSMKWRTYMSSQKTLSKLLLLKHHTLSLIHSRATFLYSSYDLVDSSTGDTFFPLPSPVTFLEGVTLTNPLAQVVGLIPIVLFWAVFYLSLRKGFLSSFDFSIISMF